MNKSQKIKVVPDIDIELELKEVRPAILIRPAAIAKITDEAQAALKDVGFPIYERGGSLVHPVIRTVEAADGRATKIAVLKEIEPTYLRYVFSKVTDWARFSVKKNKNVLVDPPLGVAKMMLSLNVEIWPFPSIKGIIGTPTLRPDGTILYKPGYDKATGLLLVGAPPMPPIPDRPTRDDALKALALLKGLLVEFPLVDGPSISTALSAFITPIVRAAFPVSPIHIARAPNSGTGKSYLWDTASAIAIGEIMPIISAGPDTEEMEKRLGAGLMTGQSLISIDNINGELGGSALCQYIERPRTQPVRILGLSKNVDLDLSNTTFFASGNNISVSFEMVRRKIIADLDADIENPSSRKFENDPVKMVLADRGKYIAAALTICRAYIVAGRPNKVIPLASFEGWSDTVRSALMWIGEADSVNLTDEIQSPDRSELSEMLIAWADVIGLGWPYRIKIGKLLELATDVRRDGSGFAKMMWPELAAAAKAATGNHLDANTLGHWLRDNKGIIINGYKLMNKPDEKHGSQWWVQHRDDPSREELGQIGQLAAAGAKAAAEAKAAHDANEGSSGDPRPEPPHDDVPM
jgi:hypothetical protein